MIKFGIMVRVRRFLVILFVLPLLATPSHAWLLENGTDDFGSNWLVASTYYNQETKEKFSDGLIERQDLNYSAFGIRCMDSQLLVAYSTYVDGFRNSFLRKSTVEVRFDDGKIEKWRVSLSPGDRTFLFFTESNKFLVKLKKSKQLAIRATLARGTRVSSLFKVNGVRKLSSEFRKLLFI